MAGVSKPEKELKISSKLPPKHNLSNSSSSYMYRSSSRLDIDGNADQGEKEKKIKSSLFSHLRKNKSNDGVKSSQVVSSQNLVSPLIKPKKVETENSMGSISVQKEKRKNIKSAVRSNTSLMHGNFSPKSIISANELLSEAKYQNSIEISNKTWRNQVKSRVFLKKDSSQKEVKKKQSGDYNPFKDLIKDPLIHKKSKTIGRVTNKRYDSPSSSPTVKKNLEQNMKESNLNEQIIDYNDINITESQFQKEYGRDFLIFVKKKTLKSTSKVSHSLERILKPEVKIQDEATNTRSFKLSEPKKSLPLLRLAVESNLEEEMNKVSDEKMRFNLFKKKTLKCFKPLDVKLNERYDFLIQKRKKRTKNLSLDVKDAKLEELEKRATQNLGNPIEFKSQGVIRLPINIGKKHSRAAIDSTSQIYMHKSASPSKFNFSRAFIQQPNTIKDDRTSNNIRIPMKLLRKNYVYFANQME